MIWHRAKAYFMAVTAFVACPCHLPITLPLILAFTAGTALGSWLEGNTALIYVLATVYFVGGGLLALRWLSARRPPATHRRGRPAEAADRAVPDRHRAPVAADQLPESRRVEFDA